MKSISPAFLYNEAIPTQYTCDSANMSPALAWSDAPEGTQSFALIVDDKDTEKIWVHWILFNIPATIEFIVENQDATGEEVAFMQGATDFNHMQQWGGPCPPRPSLKASDFAPSFAKSFGGHVKASTNTSEGTASGTHHYHFSSIPCLIYLQEQPKNSF